MARIVHVPGSMNVVMPLAELKRLLTATTSRSTTAPSDRNADVSARPAVPTPVLRAREGAELIANLDDIRVRKAAAWSDAP